MKYLAILKDSLREALDSKVFYVMIGLSVLVILFFASMGFSPLPADKGLQSMMDFFPQASPFTGRPAFSYTVQDVEQLNDARPWAGEYRFTVKATNRQREGFRLLVLIWCLQKRMDLDDGGEAERQFQNLEKEIRNVPFFEREEFVEKRLKEVLQEVARKAIGPPQMERYMQAQFSDFGSFTVESVRTESAGEGEAVFRIQAKGAAENFSVWPHSQSLFFGAIGGDADRGAPPGYLVYVAQDYLLGRFGAAVAMVVATIITAFFIPNMLRKGTVDLLIVKPANRVTLLCYKYLGGLSFMFLITVVVVGGSWLVIGLRSGMWGGRFLLLIPILTFQFAIFYAVSTLFAVLTRSTIVAIMMTCGTWALLFIVGVVLYSPVNPEDRDKEARSGWQRGVEVVHYVLPRYTDIVSLTGKEIVSDSLPSSNILRKQVEKSASSYSWPESLIVSGVFIALMLGLACWWFATRDY